MERLVRQVLAIALLLINASASSAEVGLRAVEYKHDNLVLEGTLAVDGAGTTKKPGVLLVCESGGNASPAARSRAVQLAKFGYAVFAADLYGKGFSPKDAKEAALKAGHAANDRQLFRARVRAAYAAMLKQPTVDGRRTAAVGYGLGGAAVLELARTGIEELQAAVVVHGDVSTTTPADAKRIGAEVLVLVGSDDPVATSAHLAAFDAEMRSGGVDWTVIRYGGVLGDFTNPQARDSRSGRAYDADADRRAHEAVRAFLAETLVPPKAAVGSRPAAKPEAKLPAGVPPKAANVLKYVDENGAAMSGYEGGRTFLNIEQLLPKRDDKGRAIKYREWDVNPLRPGVNRGAERLVTGSEGSAYFTGDHYKSFKKLR